MSQFKLNLFFSFNDENINTSSASSICLSYRSERNEVCSALTDINRRREEIIYNVFFIVG
jgi:hypothetical protein